VSAGVSVASEIQQDDEASVVRVSAHSSENNADLQRTPWTPTLRLSDPTEALQTEVRGGASAEPPRLEAQQEVGVHIIEDEQWASIAMSDTSISSGQYVYDDGFYDGYYLDDECLVIDPEAPDSIEAEIAPEETEFGQDDFVIDPEAADPCDVDRSEQSQKKVENEHAKVSSSSSASKTPVVGNKRLVSADNHKPGLEAVLGYWWDAQGSYYEVSLDGNSSSSCSVKTTRPGGAVRATKELIRLFRRQSRFGSDSIVWGSAFVLETPLKDADQLRWRSHKNRGAKPFVWFRDQPEATASSVREPAQGPKVQKPEKSSKKSGKAVWREVEAAKTKVDTLESSKTPKEVRSSTVRNVQARSGIWRVIRKDLQNDSIL
jgi:hypothetical protein